MPLKTAQTCNEILDISLSLAKNGNQNSITDAAVSALMANVGVKAAIFNVKINLTAIKDQKFVEDMISELERLNRDSSNKTDKIIKFVDSKI